MYVLLQKEMADRIMAGPGSKTYGALTVTLGFYYEPQVLFKVSRESFYPRPEVTSSFVRLVRKGRLPLEGGEIELFHLMVKSAFWGRRKTMLKALSESPHLEIGREIAARMLEHAGDCSRCTRRGPGPRVVRGAGAGVPRGHGGEIGR